MKALPWLPAQGHSQTRTIRAPSAPIPIPSVVWVLTQKDGREIKAGTTWSSQELPRSHVTQTSWYKTGPQPGTADRGETAKRLACLDLKPPDSQGPKELFWGCPQPHPAPQAANVIPCLCKQPVPTQRPKARGLPGLGAEAGTVGPRPDTPVYSAVRASGALRADKSWHPHSQTSTLPTQLVERWAQAHPWQAGGRNAFPPPSSLRGTGFGEGVGGQVGCCKEKRGS